MASGQTKRTAAPPEDTREKLLQAAIQEFSDHGFGGATVRAICRRAGVNLALVNYHFGDKLALYRAVIRYAADADAKAVILHRALEENADPVAALRQIIRSALERLIPKEEVSGLKLRLMSQEALNPSGVMTDEFVEAIRPLYDKFRTVVGRILDLPANHTTTRLCTHSIMGQIMHYVHSRQLVSRLWPEMKMSGRQIAMVADHIADLSLAYLQTANSRVSNSRERKTSLNRS